MPPLISFETGRKHKLNLLFKTTRWSETANGSLVLSEIGTTAEKPTHAAKNQKEFTPALLRSASGELLPSLQKLPLGRWGVDDFESEGAGFALVRVDLLPA